MNCDVLDRYLDLYLDGELAAEERAEVEVHLRACGPCREAATIEARLRAAVRQTLLSVRAPGSLHEAVAQRVRDGRLPVHRTTLIVAYAAVVTVVAGAGYGAVAFFSATSPADDAVAVHLAASGSEVLGDRGQVTEFLKTHAPFAFQLPLEDREGVRLVGARVTTLGAVPAVVYLYDVDGQRVSVAQYPQGDLAEDHVRLDRRSGVTVASWFRPVMPVRKVVTRSLRGMLLGEMPGAPR